MKQLILTFFAVIFCYSLFFDKEPKAHAIDKINYINEDAASVPIHELAISDTVNYLAMYNVKTIGWNFYIPQYEETNCLR